MDWFTLAACMWLVVYGAIGYWRGLWHSLGSLLGLILAYFASVVLAGPCRDVWVKVLDSPNINSTLLYGASAAAIFVIVGRYTERTAYALLDLYLSYSGASSIRAAIEADTTLGGICSTLIVQSSAEVTSLNSADAEFLEIQFKVEVHG